MSKDSQLQRDVLNALAWEPSLESGHIGVTSQDGLVTLSGHVTSFAQKNAAEAAAAGVRGVKAVVEEIEVRLPSEAVLDDEAIAASAVSRLALNGSIPKAALTVTVEGGWITLNGHVDWNYERQAAEDDVRRLLGVRGVSNRIAIKRKVDIANLSDEITHALHRSWFFDPKTIDVTAQQGRVRLAGTVRSPHERGLAAATAWAAPGVTDVQNDLVVV
jgi:osmotically-inducible protein OsmY